VSPEQLHEMAEANARTRKADGLLDDAARRGRSPERGPAGVRG
jgi:hypothetical protein